MKLCRLILIPLILNLASFVFAAPTVTVIAGTGIAGYSGDGGSALKAALRQPQTVAFTPDRTLLIADAGNHRVRKVDGYAFISTLAGDGTGVYDASWNGRRVAFPAAFLPRADGTLWIADVESQRLLKWNSVSGLTSVLGEGNEGAALPGASGTGSSLLYPSGLAQDGDDLLLSEMGTGRILRVTASGTVLVEAAGFRSPWGLSRDVDDALLVADYGDGAVYRLKDGSREIAASLPVPLSVDGPLLTAIPLPSSAVVGPDGSLYVSAPDAGTVTRIPPGGGMEPFLASPDVSRPVGLCMGPDSRLYVADEGLNQVLAVALPYAAPKPGDLDDDGQVSVTDAVLALKLVVGQGTFSRRQYLAADLVSSTGSGAGDRRVTVGDVVILLRRIAGLE